MLTEDEKKEIKRDLVLYLAVEKEIRKIVIFGSFLDSLNPHDLDVAVFQDSHQSYLSLALKYRKDIRPISRRIAVDIFPIRMGVENDSFLSEVKRGEVVYER
ncbi:MAG: nucleotidyltransferase domain-containing protein [Chlamydiae bacterium]|nr:nucleotidyltransferase domain-containing protein [Chlamydiota bacterium]MBI3266895.1 nucleotidyltransferase domain-containing protein [Chlamydiota bacterium]